MGSAVFFVRFSIHSQPPRTPLGDIRSRYNAPMGDRDKKPWQFSLKRAMGAMTLICVWTAVLGSLLSDDGYRNAGEEGVYYLAVSSATMGLGSVIGVIVAGIRGAILAALLGLVVSIPIYVLLKLIQLNWSFII